MKDLGNISFLALEIWIAVPFSIYVRMSSGCKTPVLSAAKLENLTVLPFWISFAEPSRFPLLSFTASRLSDGRWLVSWLNLQNSYLYCVSNNCKRHMFFSAHQFRPLECETQPQMHELFSHGRPCHLNYRRQGREKIFLEPHWRIHLFLLLLWCVKFSWSENTTIWRLTCI